MRQVKEQLKGKQRAFIDWEEVGRRMKAAEAAIESGWLPDREKRKEILRKRALVLAEEKEVKVEGEYIEVLQFLLAYETYAVEYKHVLEVCHLKELTHLPCAPDFVLGIINVRGRIVSVIDIKKFFDLPDRGLGDLNKVIILRSDDMEFGVLADVITGVQRISVDALQPPLATLKGIGEDYIMGITDDRVVVLDGARVLSDRRIVVDEQG